jgi:tellurite resistance protein TerC
MATQTEHAIEPESNPVVRLVRRLVPVTGEYHGQRFFVRQALTPGGAVRLVATPLLVVLVLVETTDLIFAVDSIPAIFAVTTDPFLVYTSNVFAILGLRSLYFLLANVVDRFHLLKYGLAVILTFVGVKMVLSDFYDIPILISLAVVVGVLVLSIVLSLVFPRAATLEPHEVKGTTGSLFGGAPPAAPPSGRTKAKQEV